MSNFDWIWGDDELETGRQIDSRSIIRTNKRRLLRTSQKDKLADVLPLPNRGESLHMMSNGTFDFFTIASILIDVLGGITEHLYASTWTINQATIADLFDYVDIGKIEHLHILTDRSYKRRKPSDYAQLVAGIRERNQRFIASKNHSKVVLLNNGDNYISIEGSASFTTNPRLEQHVISNDKELWLFHQNWMNELFSS